MQGDPAACLILTDEPYNVPISGHVTGGQHREFAMASGEMSDAEFLAFNEAWMAAVLPGLCDGGIFCTFIDWRGLPTVHLAAVKVGLVPQNLIVWAKTNAGMGSLYRSQHELLPLFKNGSAPHTNNVELGKRGRWRSNVWTYPGASSLGSDARRGLKDHPPVKPTAMLEDALLDLTNRGDIVIDPFLGSGSTLIAADKTGRVCRGVELDPLYVDVIVRRYEAATGAPAVLVETGETFEALAARRALEPGAGLGSEPNQLDWFRREAAIADRGRGCRKWAVSGHGAQVLPERPRARGQDCAARRRGGRIAPIRSVACPCGRDLSPIGHQGRRGPCATWRQGAARCGRQLSALARETRSRHLR
jgi:DNA modification methylase